MKIYGVLRRAFRWFSRGLSWVRHHRYRLCLTLEKPFHQSISLGKGVRFEVPVQSKGGRGSIMIGERVTLGYRLAPMAGSGTIRIQPREATAAIEIGFKTAFSNNVSIIARESVRIGQRCLIGDFVSIVDADFHEIDPSERHRSHGRMAPVVIGNNVWLGSRVVVLKGVTIGENTVVGAGSVVARSLPANVLAGGVPARVIRNI